jgi:signal transduction histidine kinase
MNSNGLSIDLPIAAKETRPAKRFIAGLLAGGCVAAATLIYSFYRQQLTWVRSEQGRTLVNIANIKAAAIAAWRRERIADGTGAPLTPAFAGFVREYLEGRADSSAEQEIRKYFEVLKVNHDYTTVLLFDASGRLRLANPPTGVLEQSTSSMVLEALKQERVLFEDFYSRDGVPPRLAVVGPICDTRGSCPGAIKYIIDPARFLYPHIQTWPTPSQTGETLLVRRENSNIVYLNELRHWSNTALKLKMPVNSPGLPAAKVVLGAEGLLEGTDYRGIPVFAAVRRIPDSPWFLVTKIDRAEAFAGLRTRTAYFAVITLLLLIAGSCTLLLAWSRREFEHYQQAVDQRRQAEQELRHLNARLEQRVRERTCQLEATNKELEAFAYSVSHDLRAPLRGIDGWTLALIEDYCHECRRADHRGREYLDRVRSEAQRMGSLIDALLELSRITRAEIQRDNVDLTSIAHKVAARLREVNAQRQIEFDIEPGLTTFGDARLLEIALTNLLGNAVKFTGTRALARVEVGQAGQNGGSAFYVRDNGVGFDMAYLPKLFGAFQRFHKTSEFPGTGIGLATVQRIVRRHGGQVWAEAQPDHGATFYFVLGEDK